MLIIRAAPWNADYSEALPHEGLLADDHTFVTRKCGAERRLRTIATKRESGASSRTQAPNTVYGPGSPGIVFHMLDIGLKMSRLAWGCRKPWPL
jgi:hypothetical protein